MKLQINAQEGIEVFVNSNGGITLMNDQGNMVVISTPEAAAQISKAITEMAAATDWIADYEEDNP